MGHSHGASKQAPEIAPEVTQSPVKSVSFSNELGDSQDDDDSTYKISAPILVPTKAENPAGSEAAARIVHIYLRCADLSLHHDTEPTTFVVGYSKLLRDEAWVEIGRTENAAEKSWPNYGEGFKVPFCAEVTRLLRFEVYRLKDALDRYDLSRQYFIGGAEICLVDPISLRSVKGGDGWLTKDLLSHKDIPRGKIAIWAEENHSAKNMVAFDISGWKLRCTDMWKLTTDPYLVFHRTHAEDEESASNRRRLSTCSMKTLGSAIPKEALPAPKLDQAVMRTEVIRRRTAPKWKRVEDLSSQDLSHGNPSQPIVIEVWDWFRTCKPRLIGSTETTFDAMFSGFCNSTSLDLEIAKRKKGKKVKDVDISVPTGQISLGRIGVERRFSFLDYIRGGAIVTPILAVDMTRGNLKKSKHGRSLHQLDNDHLNDYETSIQALYEVLGAYQGPEANNAYPIYGFGAKIPPAKSRTADCFSLTGDFLVPFAVGIPGLLSAYQNSLRIATLHGPTRLKETIELAADWARPYARAEDLSDEPGPNQIEQRYFVLIILTKGCVEDQQATLNSICKTVGLPLSIVVIGIGNEDHSYLETLNDESRAGQQLNLQVSCPEGHKCHQVTQSIVHQTHNTCSECSCNVSTCQTRWDCHACGISFCETCSIEIARKMAKGPVQRDMVHFVKFNSCRSRPGSLASEALSKVAGDVVSYYKALNVKPRGLGKFENPQGQPLPRETVEKPTAKSRASFADAVAAVQNSNRRVGLINPLDVVKAVQNGDRSVSKATSEAGSVVSRLSSLAVSTATGLNSVLSLRSDASGLSAVEEEPELDLKLLVPKFLQERRKALAQEARALGYNLYKVQRVLDDGVAEDSLEALVENLVHAASNGSYKDAMVKATPRKQVPSEQSSRASSKDVGEMSRRSSRLSAIEDNISLTDFEDDAGTLTLSSRSPSSSYTRNFGPGRSQGGTKETSGSHGKSSNGFVGGVGRSAGGTKETVVSAKRSNLKGTKESLRIVASSKETVGGRRGSLKGTKESLRIAASSKELSFDDPKSPTFALPGEVLDEGTPCTICLEQPINVELLPCRHRVACEQCMSQAGSLCPLCQTFVTHRQMF